jgi:hypothetical protein
MRSACSRARGCLLLLPALALGPDCRAAAAEPAAGFAEGARPGEAAAPSPDELSAHDPRSREPAGDEPDDETRDIEVTGAMRPASARTAVPPELRVGRVLIRGLGADNLAEAIEAFAPQSDSLRSDGEPILLLDGRRIGGRAEIDGLPVDAIRRIEIFPEDVALRYGYPPDRRVVNVVLRPRYETIELQARADVPLGEGRATRRAKAGLLRLTPDGRLNLDIAWRRQGALVEGRAEAGSPAAARWLLPRTDRITASAVHAFRRGAVALTASATASWQAGERTLGTDTGAKDTGGRGLRRRETRLQGRAGITANGEAGAWLWSAAGSARMRRDRFAAREAGAAGLAGGRYGGRGTAREFEITASASGTPSRLPAGPVLAAFAAGLALRRHDAAAPGPPGGDRGARQDSGFVSASLDIPLAPAEALVLVGEGRLTWARGEGLLARHGLGLRGSPAPGLSFSLSYSRDRALPDFADLAETAVRTPAFRVYDFADGATRLVERLDGGNPRLRPPDTRSYALRLQFRPRGAGMPSLSVDYGDLARRGGSGERPGVTPQIEAAFPERFARDAAGRLTGIDRRPIDLARQQRRELRWGLNLAAAPGAAAVPPAGAIPPAAPRRLQIALYHTVTLHDVAVLRPGAPRADLLRGAAIGERGGTSRHRIEAQVGYAAGHHGVRLAAGWRSPSQVRGGAAGPALHFRHGVRLDLRAYLDLRPVREALGLRWLQGRLHLVVDNLLGDGLRIRDRQGRRVAPDRGSDDGFGRSLRLSFRKAF